MPWVLLEYNRPAKKDVRRITGKTHFYADQNVGVSIIEVLRHLKYEVETAAQVGGQHQIDEWHYRRAFKTKRVLLTHDHDFLDSERFPLSQTSGVIVINVDTDDTAKIARALEVIDTIFGGMAPYLKKRKLVVNSDYTIRVIESGQDVQGAFEQEVRYRFDENGRDIWVWELEK